MFASRIHQGGNSIAKVWPAVDKKASHSKTLCFYNTALRQRRTCKSAPWWKNTSNFTPTLCPRWSKASDFLPQIISSSQLPCEVAKMPPFCKWPNWDLERPNHLSGSLNQLSEPGCQVCWIWCQSPGSSILFCRSQEEMREAKGHQLMGIWNARISSFDLI